ncbi:MAG: MBL fold metallo-hydrolase [Anaerolineae bacterium]
MDITFLGTCSGTEPMPGRRHISFVVESGGGVYWFDAGEGCSHTAHTLGVDLLAVRAVFISHSHIDHVGGLANLVWTMHKLESRNHHPGRSLRGRAIPLFLPALVTWQGILQMLGSAPGHFQDGVAIEGREYSDGVIFADDVVKVTARHNRHLGEPGPGQPWRSFSFLIEAGGKAVVYSRDVASVDEIEPLVGGCDLILMETGHHEVESLCRHLLASGKEFGRLGFVHHGRAILGDADGQLTIARRILGDRVFVADDGMKLAL